MDPLLNVAIIGAGPGGLTLANLLQKYDVSFSVFESDASPNQRNQGGTLDLHRDAGQAALREACLWEDFMEHARPESAVLKVVQQDGRVLWDGNTKQMHPSGHKSAFSRPEIDREKLKEILLRHLDETRLHYGKTFSHAVFSEKNGTWALHFRDGSEEDGFNLIVGADGAWSKTRKLLSDVHPFYSGITAIESWALDVRRKHPWMVDYVGQGSLFSFGADRTIQIQRIGDGSIRTYACLRKPENFIQECGIDWSKPDIARKELVRQYYGDCGDDLKRMILESSDQLIARPLYMLPVGMRWKLREGVTLLGDAAHLMTPFAGVGVNAAMLDAMELARHIRALKIGKVKTLVTALEQYESELFSRGEKFARKTMQNLEMHFSEGGCAHLVRRLKMLQVYSNFAYIISGEWLASLR